jgi:ankyrin repeat protein
MDAQDNLGYTALMRAIREEFTDIVKLLLDAGANFKLKLNDS